jgi:hypothetical protein
MTTRKAVPLTPDEISAVDAARTSGVLTELAGESAGRSESSALHALVMLGLQTVKEHRRVEGYAALAAAQDDEDRAYGAAIRGRRRGGSE